MYSRIITDPQQIPLAQSERKNTDVICTIISTIFAVVMFVIAILKVNKSTINSLYFGNLSATNPGDISSADYSGFITTILWASLGLFSLGLIWLTIVQCCPMKAPFIAILFSILSLLAIGVLLFFFARQLFTNINWIKIVVAAIFLIILIYFFVKLCVYSNQLRFQGVFLRYAVRFLTERPWNFLLIILYLILVIGLFCLIHFQHLAFSSISSKNNNYFDFSNPGVLGILNLIQFFWGLQFLNDLFTFLIAGNAAQWYWRGLNDRDTNRSGNRLLCHNWGSVVKGSFFNLFFRIPGVLLEILICHPTGCCGKCGNTCYNKCSCCSTITGLIRTDSYSYINLFGTPYCESSRQCEKLCAACTHFQGFQSPMRNYRHLATIGLVFLGIFFAAAILRYRVPNIGFWLAFDLFVLILAMLRIFVNVHASAAEENHLSGGYDYMQHCIPSFRKQLYSLSQIQRPDGKCC